MVSSSLPWRRGPVALVLFGFGLLPGACGGALDIVFVGAGGDAGAGPGGQGGEASGGADNSGGTGGGSGGGSGGTILESCGDEEVDDGEDCDEGRVDTADCDEDCTDADCGDGYTNAVAGEECDSSGEDSAECNADCTEAVCGDFYKNEAAGEECDEGADPYSPGCDPDCTFAVCGDGDLHAPTGEQCDDGNEDNGDGCSAECVQEILVIGDGISESDVINVLRSAGFAVALAPVLEYAFDGTNPVLDPYCGVIQLDATYSQQMPVEGQMALVEYVEAGGGFMSTGWSAYEAANYDLSAMSSILPLGYLGSTVVNVPYLKTTDGYTHPVTSSLPGAFIHKGESEMGTCASGATTLLTEDGYGYATLCVNDAVGAGRVVGLGSTMAYSGFRPLVEVEMETLLVNAANWLCGTSYPGPSPRMIPGSTDVVSHFGYKAQCQSWNGDVCLQPWIALNEAHVTAPIPHCIDDTTSLRPMWVDWVVEPEAATWCWIATGDPTVVAAVTNLDIPTTLGGWIYYSPADPADVYYAAPTCDDGMGRHRSALSVPVVGDQIWTFDDQSFVRDGYFPSFTCVWPG